MSSAKGKLVLILGLQRTGTTLLASMLGGHSEVNMLFESVGSDTTSLIGKKISANKLLVYRQIRLTQRASRLGHLINRIVNLDFKIKNISIKDYEKLGCKFIIIERDEKSSIDSMMSRAKQSFAEAKNEYDKGTLILTKVKALDSHTISFLDLVNNTEITLKNICEFLEIDFEKRMLEGPKYNFVYPNEKVIRKTS